MHILKYKDYEGTAELDMDRDVCRGKILFINDLVIYESESIAGLHLAFENAVDDYIETCVELGIEPQRPLKGQFNVRITPELHKACVLRAKIDGITLNELVGRAISGFINITAEVNNNFNFTIFPPDPDAIKSGFSSTAMEPKFWKESVNATN